MSPAPGPVHRAPPSRLLQILGVVCPLVAVGVAAPFTLGAAVAPGFDQFLLAVPTIIGFIGAPGYLYGLLAWRPISGLSVGRRWWVRLSFAAVIASAGVGAVFSLVLIVPSVASALTVFIAGVAWRQFEIASPAAHAAAAT